MNHLIMVHPSICHLDLSHNLIDDKMVHDIANAIEQNQVMPMERLSVSHNPLTGHKKRVLGECVKGAYEGISHLVAVTCRRVKVLELANVGLDDDAHSLESRIFGSYFAKGSIETLDLSQNNVGGK